MTTDSIEALNAEIIVETRTLVEANAARFHGDPEGELRAWLHIAARREAMVSDLYGKTERGCRLPAPRAPAGDVAWEALTLIWQQEVVHTKFIEVRLKDGMLKERALSAEFMIWLGTMEGKLLACLTGRPVLRRLFAKLAVQFGAFFVPEKVPELVLELTELELREFFLLCAALETTACECYARMEVLAEALADKLAGALGSLQIEALARELRESTLQERFHRQAFEEMAGWVVDGRLDASLTADGCIRRLHRLTPRGTRAVGDPGGGPVLTDGGLGTMFARLGLPIAARPSART